MEATHRGVPVGLGGVLTASSQMLSLGNFASGGSLGSAASTVDVYPVIAVAQTTDAKVLTLATPSNGLARFVTVCGTGSAGFYMYGRFIRPGGAHRFIYVPGAGWRRTASGPQIIYQKWESTPIAMPADTSETTAMSMTIPGTVVGANGGVRVFHKWDYTNSGNNKTMRVKISSSTIGQTIATTTAHFGFQSDFHNKNSESSQVGSAGAGIGSAGSSALTAAVDTSADFTLSITGQKGSAGETLTYLGATIILDRFD